MPIGNCPDCGYSPYSDTAIQCPHCGGRRRPVVQVEGIAQTSTDRCPECKGSGKFMEYRYTYKQKADRPYWTRGGGGYPQMFRDIFCGGTIKTATGTMKCPSADPDSCRKQLEKYFQSGVPADISWALKDCPRCKGKGTITSSWRESAWKEL